MHKKIELSVIIPTYKEKNIKEDTLRKAEVLNSLGVPFEVIIVSGDKDYKESLDLLEARGMKVFYLLNSKGKGENIFYGLKYAKGEYILYIDADNDIDPEIMRDLYYEIKNNDCDMVYADKYHKDSKIKRTFTRNLSSKVINLFIHLLFKINVTDTQTGAKIYRRDVLEKIEKMRKVKIPGFAFEVENAILLSKLNAKVKGIPVKITPSGESSIAISNVVIFFLDLIKLKKAYK